MSIKQYANEMYFVIAEDLKTDLGSFTNASCEIKHIVLYNIVVGTIAPTARFRINLYSNSTKIFPEIQSQWFKFSDFKYQTSSLNYVRFDFDKQNLNKNINYFVELEAENYVHDSNNYLGLQFDSPDVAINTSNLPNTNRGIKMSILALA